jgi:hypothetical protein
MFCESIVVVKRRSTGLVSMGSLTRSLLKVFVCVAEAEDDVPQQRALLNLPPAEQEQSLRGRVVAPHHVATPIEAELVDDDPLFILALIIGELLRPGHPERVGGELRWLQGGDSPQLLPRLLEDDGLFNRLRLRHPDTVVVPSIVPLILRFDVDFFSSHVPPEVHRRPGNRDSVARRVAAGCCP